MKSPNKAIITLGLSTSIILFLVVVRFGSIKKLAEQYIAYYELNHPLRDSESKIIDEKEIVIPFHYAKFGYIIVPVEINGHQQQFILDTGCTYSSLFQHKLRLNSRKYRTPQLIQSFLAMKLQTIVFV